MQKRKITVKQKHIKKYLTKLKPHSRMRFIIDASIVSCLQMLFYIFELLRKPKPVLGFDERNKLGIVAHYMVLDYAFV